jgi:hypothetical protein
MSAEYDVDGRLAEGRTAVDDFAEYVRACQQLGHQHPELSRPAEWYATEEGLNLTALDADAAALAAVAEVADDALRQQSELMTALSGAWGGPGAAAALDFIGRHQHAAAVTAGAVRDAAGILAGLRDQLWKAVDGKVATTLAIDGRAFGQRAAWLAAARTVATRSGDRSVASELIDQQVEPFVANDIRGDWLDAMRACSASIAAAYDAAVARLRAAPQPIFEVPGALGPVWVAPSEQVAAAAAVPSSVSAVRDAAPSPVGASAGLAPAAAAMPAPASGPAPPAPMMAEPLQAAPVPPQAASPLGDMGGGAPGPGGMGLSGLGQQLSDLIGGLVGTSADAVPELSELDPSDLDEADEEREDDEDADDEDAEDAEDEVAEDAEDEVAQDPETEDPDAEGAEQAESTEAASESAPLPEAPEGTPEPPPPQPPAPTAVPAEPGPPIPPAGAEGQAEPKTPCEIAADELPQVGG